MIKRKLRVGYPLLALAPFVAVFVSRSAFGDGSSTPHPTEVETVVRLLFVGDEAVISAPVSPRYRFLLGGGQKIELVGTACDLAIGCRVWSPPATFSQVEIVLPPVPVTTESGVRAVEGTARWTGEGAPSVWGPAPEWRYLVLTIE